MLIKTILSLQVTLTKPAIAYVADKPITLINGEALVKIIEKVGHYDKTFDSVEEILAHLY